MYVTKSSWIEAGPQRRPVVLRPCGLGAADQVIDVVGCSPDICLNLAFPWVGRRTELAPDQKQPFGSFESGACRCKPVFELPAPWGLVATAAIGGLLLVKLIKGGA
jgi:hypothetical protein